MQTSIAPSAPSAPIVRLAATSEAPAVLACVSAAFEMYIDRIGKPPAPMLLDYSKLIAERSVWVVERVAEIEGVLVQFETTDGFYIDTVASSPCLLYTSDAADERSSVD